MIFIWFMKQRNLVPNNLFDYNFIKSILRDTTSKKTTYYKAILQNLFFATLNTKTKERKFRFQKSFQGKNRDYFDQSVYRYEDYFKNKNDMLKIFKEIPFLNGGLFDCLDRRIIDNDKNIEIRIDGFSDKEIGLKVPNFLFFNDEVELDLNNDYGTKNKKYKTEGLINILQAYNFTIDENDPSDVEVALDPELLGKVFENLLASFNPETSTTARKATGSYYTPREIVDYMVSQSLKEYFKTHLIKIDKFDEKLDKLFSPNSEEENINPFNKIETKQLVKLIDNVRIVDPAVGSGAFPMGILNKLVFLLAKVDPKNEIWKDTQVKAVENNITDPALRQKLILQIEEAFEDKNFNYGRKLYLIQNCIYGVDIQQIAVEIAKLRFFISLLVDENIDKAKDNWGIEPLPNLEFKLMQGNSLISEFMGINFDEEKPRKIDSLFVDESESLIDEFQDKKNAFQNEADRKKKEKLRKEIEELIIKIFENKLKREKADYFNRLAHIEERWQGQDEVIKNEKEKVYKSTRFNLDEIEKQLREFSSGTKAKPFFLWKLYFAEIFHGNNPGFDIVIGNPPYIQLQKNGGELANLYKESNFESYTRTGDIYTLFYENGNNLLNGKGHLVFITSNKWMRAGYGEKLRKYLADNTTPKLLIDLGPDVFEAATVDTNILLFSKQKTNANCKACAIKEKLNNGKTTLAEYIKQNSLMLNSFTKDAWIILSPIEQSIKEKIEKVGTPLKDWDIKINRGILTGLNEAFIISGKKRTEILHNCKTADERKRTDELIRPILRGRDIKRYKAEFADLWLINTHNGYTDEAGKKIKRIEIDDYPAVKEHLDNYFEKLVKRDDQGDTPYNLRSCAYMEDFFKPKIIYQEMVQKPCFVYDESKNYFCLDTARIITGPNILFIYPILNSSLFFFAIKSFYSGGRLGTSGIRMKHTFFNIFPMVNFQSSHKELIQKIITENTINSLDRLTFERIDTIVYELYKLTSEEIDYIRLNNYTD
ncbi:MAG: class I SAM-dependent DNA methyltransferase [Ignavibacteriae bacterium]|nr:class I SAM-dependent DNA methyltransferase [Ignavibacteriota bacterium]NOG99722.1 class I SAM-dependent DNA methyltransferase [Ignavibacteriota bacterium]